MKKINYMLLGVAGLLMASCSQEEVAGPAGDGNVRITVNLPGDALGTRASEFGTGSSSKLLQYAVYEVNTDNGSLHLSFEGQADFGTSTSTTLNLNLLNKKYQIAFFAQSEASAADGEGVYTFIADASTATVSVDYAKMTGASNNADAYDCFYNYKEADISGASSATPASFDVTLYRPVAQINWGANDIDATNELTATFGQGGKYIMTSMSVSGSTPLPTSLDLFSGTTSGKFSGKVGNGEFAIPMDHVYPVGYPANQYVAVEYVLVGAPSEITGQPGSPSIYDLSLSISNSGNSAIEGAPYTTDVAVTNAPLQANYQTNIYGTLLSNNATFNIEVSPGFAGVYNNPLAWDGTTVTYPKVDDNEKTGTIDKASDLAGLAAMVGGTNGQTANTFEGYTFTLTADVDMGGNSLMIGQTTRASSAATGAAFKGVFDGGGNTVSNLAIVGTAEKNEAAAFIPNLDGADASVKNVTFENLSIVAPNNEQAGVVGLVTNGATVSNVTVKSGSIKSAGGAGGIAGRVIGEGTVTECVNYADVTIEGDASGGGIAGAAYYTASANGLTISKCYNYGNVTAVGSATKTIGGIVGTSGANITDCENHGAVGNSTAVGPAGGISGYQNSAGIISGCTNYGDVTGAAEVAGIVAFVGGASYTYKGDIVISDCVNNGSLTGTGSVGGIVGINRDACTLDNNTNNAPSIDAGSGSAAGIIAGGYTNNSAYFVNLIGNTNTTSLEDMKGAKTSLDFLGTVKVNGEEETKN